MTEIRKWTVDVVGERWNDVLRSLSEGGQPYEIAPWQPVPGEGRAAFVAFRAYLDNDDRSLAMVSAALSIDFVKVRRWNSEFEWELRANHYDAWLDRQSDEARAELVRRVSMETAAAFARLPAIINQAQQLVQGALTSFSKAQETAIMQGTDVEHLSINQAMKLADSMRALIEAQSRFLGQKIDVNVEVAGTVNHQVMTPALTDVLDFERGLKEANFPVPATSREIES